LKNFWETKENSAIREHITVKVNLGTIWVGKIVYTFSWLFAHANLLTSHPTTFHFPPTQSAGSWVGLAEGALRPNQAE